MGAWERFLGREEIPTPPAKAKPERKGSGFWWPKLKERESIESTAKVGAYVCWLISGVNGIGVVFGLLPVEVLVTPTITLVCGALIYRSYSRAAATVATSIFALDKALMLAEYPHHFPGLAIILTLMLLNATRATFAYHGLQNPENELAVAEKLS